MRTRPNPLLLALVLTGAIPEAASAHEGKAAPCPHCHPATATMKHATRSAAEVAIPPVPLVRDDGQAVSLAGELDDDRPVAVNFIFTSCTTICPVMSQTFAQLEEKLGPERERVRLVSISIDPEEDTPARLAEYARRWHAGPGWRFYTGTVEASVAAQKAFSAYRGDKMNHTPVTFLRAAHGRSWIRIDGFATADELARELHALVASRG